MDIIDHPPKYVADRQCFDTCVQVIIYFHKVFNMILMVKTFDIQGAVVGTILLLCVVIALVATALYFTRYVGI